eukprot:1617602-Prymnesium_polylepis.1
MSGHPAHGKVYLPSETGGLGGVALSAFTGGGLAPWQVIRQLASDLFDVSSFWPAGSIDNAWRWHPLQTLGEQGAGRTHDVPRWDRLPPPRWDRLPPPLCTDVFAYGDSDRGWSPRLKTGDSLGEFIDGADPGPVTAENVTKMLSFSYK